MFKSGDHINFKFFDVTHEGFVIGFDNIHNSYHIKRKGISGINGYFMIHKNNVTSFLPSLEQRVKDLESQVAELKKQIDLKQFGTITYNYNYSPYRIQTSNGSVW